MSLTLDKLRSLRRQAGAADTPPAPAEAAGSAGSVGATLVASPPSRASALPQTAASPDAAQAGSIPAVPAAAPPGAASASQTNASPPTPPAVTSATVGAALVANKPQSSALDWIQQTIRHADPAALAARAHGKPASLRPAPRPGQSPRTALTPRIPGQPIRTATLPDRPPHTPAASAPASAVMGAGPTATAARPAKTTTRSALDWIEQTIRHADPTTLAARVQGQASTLRPSAPRARVQPTPARLDPAAPADAHGMSASTTTVPPAVVTGGGHANAATPVPKSPGATGPVMADPLPATGRAARTCAAGPLPAQTAAASRTIAEPPTATGLVSAAAPPRSPAATAVGVIIPRDVGALQRLLATRQRALPTPTAATGSVARRDLPGEEIAPGLWLQQAHVPMAIPAAPLSLAFARRPDDSVAPADLLFFDTETTGLAGGTGTRAFMIGAADFHDDVRHGPGLRVRQLLIATLGAESAMLDAFAAWLSPSTVLSSFNGRSYDAPLLKTRYRLARRAEPLSALAHIDLLHPARRRWKGLWENCRLGTIERNVLGIERNDDLPGSQAPGAWLDYLRGGSSELLHRVAAHNHQDVVTLALLLQQLVSDTRQDSDPAPRPLQPR